jgi:hypothetical protein
MSSSTDQFPESSKSVPEQGTAESKRHEVDSSQSGASAADAANAGSAGAEVSNGETSPSHQDASQPKSASKPTAASSQPSTPEAAGEGSSDAEASGKETLGKEALKETPDEAAVSASGAAKPAASQTPEAVRPQPPSAKQTAAKPPAAATAASQASAAASAQPEAKPEAQSEAKSEAETADNAASATDDTNREPRQQPIPPPSEPMQYRAIGLVLGKYEASEEQFNRGHILADTDTKINAVLLGRVTSLVKKHLDPEQDHLWVVYPRTREREEDLHVQIVGVWEPEVLHKSDDDEAASSESAALRPPEPRKNYFSIRGEVVFYEEEEQKITVKILQSPKRPSDSLRAFKLNLRGKLPGSRTLGHFWDLKAQREGDELVVYSAERIAMIMPRKRRRRSGGSGPRSGGPRRSSPQRRPIPRGASSKPIVKSPRRDSSQH